MTIKFLFDLETTIKNQLSINEGLLDSDMVEDYFFTEDRNKDLQNALLSIELLKDIINNIDYYKAK